MQRAANSFIVDQVGACAAPGTPAMNAIDTEGRTLWLLPLLAGLLPALGVAIAFPLAVSEGQFAPCMPLLDGCVSISRAGRHGLPNHLFRALLLPGAVLQGAVWCLAGAWLRGLGAPPGRWLRALPWIGVTAAVFLVLYGTFLGTEGAWYRWMRRFGVIFYFGFTCIGMVVVAESVRRAGAAAGAHRFGARALLALVLALPLLGLVNSLAPLAIGDAETLDRFENATEWWGALVFTLFFVLLAVLWRRTRFAASLSSANR
jgi:hypothetical protein